MAKLFVIGRDRRKRTHVIEVYLVDLSDNNRMEVRWKDGGCIRVLKMAPVVPGSQTPRIGPLVCGDAQ